jgi:CDP-glucose 4,6-dehydratase
MAELQAPRSEAATAFWRGRRVLVTGATGLLGSWLVPALHARGADVTVLVRDALPRSLLVSDGWLDKVNVVRGSLTDEALLRRSFAEYGIESVFHLGAQTLVGVAKADPVGTLEANVRGTWLLLEAARQARVEQVIVASSDKAYGDSDQLLRGRFPYDCSKSCADLICSMYAQTYGMQVAISRCGNLFGGGDLNLSRLIPGAIMATLRSERFQIRSDGLFVRDFLYVEDAAAAYLSLAEGLARDPSLSGQAVNFGLELRPTMIDLVRQVLSIMGRPDLEPVVLNQASAEIREQTLDASKARRMLGWQPEHGMASGLKRTVDWYTGHFHQLAALR